MQDLPQKLENYLFENLSIISHLKPWREEKGLPYFLRDLYTFYECELLSQSWLVMAVRGEVEVTPATIRKHIGQLQKKWDSEILYLHPSISTYNRKRLIEQKISFVVPGNQMYLPVLGIDLREYIRNKRAEKIKKFSPSTQALVLSLLYDWPEGGVTPSQLAAKLGYTSMTMTRAFDEIEAAGVADISMKARERVLCFEGDRKGFWEACLQHLRSPASKRVKVQLPYTEYPLLLAGESALSRCSMLSAPTRAVYAASSEQWKIMRQELQIDELPFHTETSIVVEVWRYAPELLSKKEMVDPLSLYLSLKDSNDERVEDALLGVMVDFKW
jgi:hypothetical protein